MSYKYAQSNNKVIRFLSSMKNKKYKTNIVK